MKKEARQARRGRIQTIARGGGFLIGDDGQPDWYVPAEAMNGAMDGDTVAVSPYPPVAGATRISGAVTEVLERAHTQVVGTVMGGSLLPDQRRLPKMALVFSKGEPIPADGMKAVAHIDRYPVAAKPMRGHIVERLGQKGERGVDVVSICRRYGLRDMFLQDALEAAARIPDEVLPEQLAKRRDLRDWVTFTIDGRGSRDFDDAVSAMRLDSGNLLLGVHIADVAAYVPENGPLDREARLRGTSVYFPFHERAREAEEKRIASDKPDDPLETGVIPMLPEKLSTGVCSLNQGVDRLTLSCLMEVDNQGAVVNSEIVEGVIRSRRRLAYQDVTALLEGSGTRARNARGGRYSLEEIQALAEENRAVLPALGLLKELYEILSANRKARGAMDFDLPESDITIDENGRAVGLRRAERGVSNRIIEECMLLANETVAKTMLAQQAPILYRVHEKPDQDRIAALNAFLGTMGYQGVGAKGKPSPRELNRVLEKAAGTPEEGLIGRILLRSMQKARYGETCLGHFGLALGEYCHFTSPIRRYPDLFTHRTVKLWLSGGLEKERKRLAQLARELGEQTSAAERNAMEAERAADDLKKCEYMAGRVGSDYQGVVSGVTAFGLFVELPNTAEGLVRLSAFQDDYYEWEPERYRIVGRNHGGVIRLGDSIQVVVNTVDLDGPSIDFLPKTDYHGRDIIYNPTKPIRKGGKAPEKRRRKSAAQQGGKGRAPRKRHKGAGPKQKGKA